MQVQLNLKFAALTDPTRTAMILRLFEGQATVSEIAEPIRRSSIAILSPSRSLRSVLDVATVAATRSLRERTTRHSNRSQLAMGLK